MKPEKILAHVLVAISLMTSSVHADVFTHVPEATAEDYQVLYELPITIHDAVWAGATSVPYALDNSATAPAFDRVAYYLELTNSSGTQWVYASMDAFTANAGQLGLPHSTNNPVVHQREVKNMNVFSNVAGVTTGGFLDSGQLEMWPSSYTNADGAGVFAATDVYDWGDSGASTAAGYGSFQIHNPHARQTVFAFNRWGAVGVDDIGIGNRANTDVDWTLAGNSASYTARKLVILVRPRKSNVVFTQLPKNRQLYPRNVTTNQAQVPIAGTESFGGFEQVVLKVSRNGVFQSEQTQALVYAAGSAPFSFAPTITAELAEYEFEVLLEKAGQRTLVQRVTNVVAGDVFLFYGQSNTVARRGFVAGNTSANGYASPWVRTFGQNADSGTVARNILCWSQAEGDGGGGGGLRDPGSIGQWALVLGRKIVDTQAIPVAILNGARGGYSMPQLQRDDTNPDNLDDDGAVTRPYNRLRYRILQAGVAAKARAMFFYQGESDAGNIAQHNNGFAALKQDWQTDYPGLEHFYVSQLHVGCGRPASDVGVRELQRSFADVYDNLTVMATNALGGHDGCHYSFVGYEKHGLNHLPLVRRDLYGVPAPANSEALNPATVQFVDATRDKIRLTLRNAGDTVNFPAGALPDFVLTGTAAKITSHTVNGHVITFQLDGPADPGTSLEYRAHDFSTGSWVTNANGIGLLGFSQAVTAPPGPSTSLIAPASSQEADVGEAITVTATGTAGTSGNVVKMILLANGVPQFETNGATLTTTWTVPVAGAHRLVVRSIDEQGNFADAGVSIVAGPHANPAGVTNGLLTWMKAEAGVLRDASGNVTSWQDQSGNNNHAIQAASASQPKYVEKLFGMGAGVRFDGGDFLAAAAGMSTGSYTKVVRFFITNTISHNNLISSTTAGTTAARDHALYFAAGQQTLKMYHTGNFATATTSTPLAQTAVAIATYDAVSKIGTLYLNGVPAGSGTAAGNNTIAGFQLGAHISSGFLNGGISEAIIYNRVLDANERGSLFNHLDDKYRTPFQRWQKNSITAGQNNLPEGDPDGDGLTNAQEYAFGSNPMLRNPQNAIQPTVIANGSSVIVTYQRAINRPDIIVRLESSPDLATWQAVADVSGGTNGGSEMRAHTEASSGRKFYRLVVEMP
ncbi:MAG: sialate O-acetylesterase [Verrucomicrobiota bacterium]